MDDIEAGENPIDILPAVLRYRKRYLMRADCDIDEVTSLRMDGRVYLRELRRKQVIPAEIHIIDVRLHLYLIVDASRSALLRS